MTTGSSSYEYLEDIISTAEQATIDTASAEVGRLGGERAKVSRFRLVEKEKVKFETERKKALSWQKLANEHVRAESALTVLPVAALQD